MTPLVILPNYGGLRDETRDSLDQLGWERLEVRGSGSIDRVRSEMASRWVRDLPQPWALWVDSDMVFTPEDAQRLVEADHPFVTGFYITHEESPRPVVEFLVETVHVGPDTGGLYPVAKCGLGFVLMHKSVFRALDASLPEVFFPRFSRLGKPYFIPQTVEEEGPGKPSTYKPEDHVFCWRLRRAGVRMMCETRASVGHVGTKVYRHSDLMPRTIYKNLELKVTVHDDLLDYPELGGGVLPDPGGEGGL